MPLVRLSRIRSRDQPIFSHDCSNNSVQALRLPRRNLSGMVRGPRFVFSASRFVARLAIGSEKLTNLAFPNPVPVPLIILAPHLFPSESLSSKIFEFLQNSSPANSAAIPFVSPGIYFSRSLTLARKYLLAQFTRTTSIPDTYKNTAYSTESTRDQQNSGGRSAKPITNHPIHSGRGSNPHRTPCADCRTHVHSRRSVRLLRCLQGFYTLESRHVKETIMGLAEDLKALQGLRGKG